ncbi:hypothetical protein [Pendulispora albinea]|uniref:Uncharacterized protein n=1 Tax=Pendulispora albinea TaxID=2741071 RepID=A0ABZ2M5Y2_9BACT
MTLALAPLGAAVGCREARAEGLSQAELLRIERGETVVRPQTLDLEGHRYVGGVTYTIVAATPEELTALMDDESAYGQVLPRAKFVRRLDRTRDRSTPDASRDAYMEVHHGNALIDAAYTLHLKKEPEHARIRFWVDLSRPHDLEDAWGYFRYAALPGDGGPRVLLTYGALVNLGNGIVRSLYEERIRVAMLSLPQRLRDYVARTRRR